MQEGIFEKARRQGIVDADGFISFLGRELGNPFSILVSAKYHNSEINIFGNSPLLPDPADVDMMVIQMRRKYGNYVRGVQSDEPLRSGACRGNNLVPLSVFRTNLDNTIPTYVKGALPIRTPQLDREFPSDSVLVAVGRKPNTNTLKVQSIACEVGVFVSNVPGAIPPCDGYLYQVDATTKWYVRKTDMVNQARQIDQFTQGVQVLDPMR